MDTKNIIKGIPNMYLVIILIVILALVLVATLPGPAPEACGDGVCTETCSTCPQDCGVCETVKEPEAPETPTPSAPTAAPAPPAEDDRTLEENIFEDTIGIETEDGYKEDGYVIVRYFYNFECVLCSNPVNWLDVTKEIAQEMDDIVILELFNTKLNKWATDRWATTGMDTLTPPVIRIEGMPGGEHAYKVYYGALLNDMYDSPKEELVQEICEYTDEC
jgi:hypothetical protein